MSGDACSGHIDQQGWMPAQVSNRQRGGTVPLNSGIEQNSTSQDLG